MLLSVDPAAWQQEACWIGEHLAAFGPRLPVQLWEEHDALLERLKAAGAAPGTRTGGGAPAVTRTLVQEVMTTPVVTATEAMGFRDLAALLYARDIGAVPVVGGAGQLLGVVSRPDLIPKTAGLAAAARLCPRFGSRRRERRRRLKRAPPGS